MSQKQTNSMAVITAWCVCILAAVFYCYEFFLRVAPSVMVPNLMSAYGVTAGGLAVMSATYYYIYTPMQLPVGILMDRYGPRRLLTLAVLLCALGSLLIAGFLNLYVGAFARLLMGFGSAFAFVGVLKLAAHWLPPSRLAFVSGMSTALGMLGAVAGDTALTSMVESLGWRSSWVIAGIAGLVLTVLVWLVIHDNPVHKRHMKRETRSWGQAWKYFLSIAKNRQFWINGLIGGVMFLPVSVFGALWGISFLEQAYGFSSHQAGFSVSMLFIGVAVSGPIMGWFSSYIKRRRIILMMGSLGAAILFFVLLYVPELSLTAIQVILFFIGTCVGCQVVVFAVGCEISSPKAAGTAVAGTNFLVMIGGAVFQPVAGKLLDVYWTYQTNAEGLRVYGYHDFQIALCVLPISLLLGFFLSFFLKETYCKQQAVDIHQRHHPQLLNTHKHKSSRKKDAQHETDVATSS